MHHCWTKIRPLFFSTAVWALLTPGLSVYASETTPAENLHFAKMRPDKSGGAILEYPVGRYVETSPPQFFKWTLINPAQTVSLKVYRISDNNTYEETKDLIARYDFLDTTQSMDWSRNRFSRGKYFWILETFNQKDSEPVSIDHAYFQVEEMKTLNLRTRRFGIATGFSRGSFKSQDNNFDLEFDTTPTLYGGFVKGGKEKSIYDASIALSDFLLQGSVYRSLNLTLDYAFRFKGRNPYEVELFLGPGLRATTFPLITSSDGENLSSQDISILSPGLIFVVQQQLDPNISIYSQVRLNMPIAGTENVKIGLDDFNFSYNGGMLFNLFWPIGFGGEIVYRNDRTTIDSASGEVKTNVADWAFVGNFTYGF